MGLILRAGQILDGAGNPPLLQGEVLIEGGKIRSLGAAGSHPTAGCSVREFANQTLTPGFIDLHHHPLYLTKHEFQQSEMRPNRAAMVLQGVETARRWLEQGVTTARVVGTPFDLDHDLRDMIAQRPEMGPRLVTAGRMMTMTGGKRTPWDAMKDEVSGPEEARRWARLHIKEGADVVKLYCTTLLEEDVATYLTAVMALPDDAPDPGRWASLTIDEIAAVCAEAHNAGCSVAAHVAPAFGIRLALLGGVDTIEHGSDLDGGCIALFLETGATLVPTLSISHHQIVHAAELGLPQVYTDFALRRWARIKQGVREAFEAGVAIATGTDPVLEGMEYPTEMELLVECGLPPMEAICAATGRAAAAMRTAGRLVGTLEPGKWADIVLLDQDPLTEIGHVRDVVAVWKGGELVHQAAAWSEAEL
ncbi:MAG: amidohydrolase family protein [Caldilineaceae bacterium]